MTKYIPYTLLIISIIFFVSIALSRPNGITGRTSPTFSSGCGITGCHGNQSTTTTVNISGPTNVYGGTTHSYSVTVSNSLRGTVGSDIGVKTTFYGDTSIGSLTPGSGMRKDNSNGEITHSSPHSMVGNSAVFNFTWTAPNIGGTYYMRATGNVVNDDNNDSGNDSIIGGNWKFGTPMAITVTIPANQTINLNAGWNMISVDLNPNSTNLDTIFSSILSRIVMIKDGVGDIYIPSLNINTIGSWNNQNGYMAYLTQQSNLSISGTELYPQSTSISLQSGWNLIPYLRNSSMRIDSALASIDSNITIVKDNIGNIYVPSFGINTIGNLVPGQAYMIYLSQVSTLNYPAN